MWSKLTGLVGRRHVKLPSSFSGPALNVTGAAAGRRCSVSPGSTPIGSPPSMKMLVVTDGVTLNVSLPARPLTEVLCPGVVHRLEGAHGDSSARDGDRLAVLRAIDDELIAAAQDQVHREDAGVADVHHRHGPTVESTAG